MKTRPKDDEELEKRAAIGVIRASRFIRKYSRSQKTIDFDVVRSIHKEIWKDAWPEIAGENRIEDLKISDSKLLLPHFTDVPRLVEEANAEFTKRISSIGDDCLGQIESLGEVNEEVIKCIDRVVTLAAWIHHIITFIHPFREGNGRTARLAANLILERYGLVGISVKIEKENKNSYRKALSQIDSVRDYEPLKNLIYEGLNERYHGVKVKYYSVNGKQK